MCNARLIVAEVENEQVAIPVLFKGGRFAKLNAT